MTDAITGTPAWMEPALRLVQAGSGLAALVSAAEWWQLVRRGRVASVWPRGILRPWWGWRAPLMEDRVVTALAFMQPLLAAALLALSVVAPRPTMPPMVSTASAVMAAGLAFGLWHTAVRVRGTFNGGSDGMLFLLLVAVATARAPLPSRLCVGAVLFAAAQLLLSYLRAGLVKAREGAWWRGDALAGFLAVPAYGVPAWVPRSPVLLRVVAPAVVLFELLAPVALLHPTLALVYAGVAWGFHLAVAVVLGLNRFLLVWGAALPLLWVAAQMLRGDP